MSNPYFVQDIIKLKSNIIIFYLSENHTFSKNVSEKERARDRVRLVERSISYSCFCLNLVIVSFLLKLFTVKKEGVQLSAPMRNMLVNKRGEKKEGRFVLN